MAAARAEARRKAILSRGNDRLAKLTTSARGEDAPAYMHDDPPLPSLKPSFGEDSLPSPVSTPPRPQPRLSASPSPAPPSPSPTPSSRPGQTRRHPSANMSSPFEAGSNSGGDPSAWSEEQQQQFLRALMGGAAGMNEAGGMFPGQANSSDEGLPPQMMTDNPLAAMLFSQLQQQGQNPNLGGDPLSFGGKPQAQAGVTAVPEPTRLQRLMPFVHLVAMWGLLAYFILWRGGNGTAIWTTWADLGARKPMDVLGAQAVPFFWAFATLQIVLHSVRIFSGFDAVRPPTLVALALPHLPPPFPSLIINGMKYFQMGALFLDDVAALLVGIGMIVLFSGWFSGA